MTKEEAIKWLEETKLGGRIMHDDTVIQVCDMAISAIKEQRLGGHKWVDANLWLPAESGRYLCRYYFKGNEGILHTDCLDYYETEPISNWKHPSNHAIVVTHWMLIPNPRDRMWQYE